MSIKVCPECGSEFTCDGDSDCWCEHVPIHRAQMVEILGLYTDCLCPECLNRYQAKE
jgi:hypothetical protein